MTGYGWITVASFSFVIFIAACGVLTVPFLVIAEILPEKVNAHSIDIFDYISSKLPFILDSKFWFSVSHQLAVYFGVRRCENVSVDCSHAGDGWQHVSLCHYIILRSHFCYGHGSRDQKLLF